MINYHELRWGNAFSYGPKNVLRLDNAQLTQIVGKNGYGKSTIALLLEESQFNTNSKKVKKADILNRYTKDKSYFIELDFSKDGTPYTIITNRTNTTASVKLLCSGVDISSHTATGTYKAIEHILGYDHKTFSQIIYQSSVSALEFLTAPDTARKKFLIDLLSLARYTNAQDVFKKLASDSTKLLDTTKGKLSTVQSWLTKYSKENLEPTAYVEVPESPDDLVKEATALQLEMNTAGATNKRITQNNQYKVILDRIEPSTWTSTIPNRDYFYNSKQVELVQLRKELKDGKALASKCHGPTTKCPTCSQDVDNSRMFTMATTFAEKQPTIEGLIATLEAECKAFEETEKAYAKHLHTTAELEKYYALYDPNLATVLLDEAEMLTKFKKLKTEIIRIQGNIEDARRVNKVADEHNAKINVIKSQLVEMTAEAKVLSEELNEVTKVITDLDILVKSFGSTGVVAYKIEGMVKDLESLTNEYLAEMSGGRFQLSFQMNASDKLNVVITDNGRDIDIVALSSGERARVNVSTLLAIRKLMQSLSNSRTNLLILDETVENLDAEGKEKLIEVLLKEENLNTFLISHGFSHPLLEKVSIVKEHNVSRIE